MSVSQPISVDPGWTGGSHCKPQLTVEVAEVVQGVEDELPLRGISAVGGANTSEGLAGGALE